MKDREIGTTTDEMTFEDTPLPREAIDGEIGTTGRSSTAISGEMGLEIREIEISVIREIGGITIVTILATDHLLRSALLARLARPVHPLHPVLAVQMSPSPRELARQEALR